MSQAERWKLIARNPAALLEKRDRRRDDARPEDDALLKRLDQRLLDLHVKVLDEFRDHLEQDRAVTNLQFAAPAGNA